MGKLFGPTFAFFILVALIAVNIGLVAVLVIKASEVVKPQPVVCIQPMATEPVPTAQPTVKVSPSPVKQQIKAPAASTSSAK